MTDPEREPESDLSAEARRARDLLRRLEAPRADGGFRARLKEEFVAGRFPGSARGRERVADGGPEDEPRRGGIGPLPEGEPDLVPNHRQRRPSRPGAPARPAPGRTRAPWPGRRWIPAFPKPTKPRWIAVLAAAAAVAVVAGILGNRGPEWRVLNVDGTGVVQADGEPIPIERLELLAERLRPGVEINVPPTASIEIAAGSDLAMEILPGTSLTIPPSMPRWFLRRSELYARAGEMRITTGPTFADGRLELHTPEAKVMVWGTTFAVIMEPAGTCVCVLEGNVMVGPRGEAAGPDGSGGDAMMPVSAGRRFYVFRDGRTPERAEIRPGELIALARFRALRYELMETMTHP